MDNLSLVEAVASFGERMTVADAANGSHPSDNAIITNEITLPPPAPKCSDLNRMENAPGAHAGVLLEFPLQKLNRPLQCFQERE